MEIVSLFWSSSARHNHSQSGLDERKGKWGNIIYHILLWGEGGEGELGITKVSIVYSIRMGVGGGGGEGGGRTMLGGRYIHCAPSPLLYQT